MIDIADGRATPGGGPFNTARALARLGVPAAFVGHLSDDAYGRMLLATLASDGVNLEFVSIGHEKTTLAIASLGTDGAARYDFEVAGTSAPQLTPSMLPAHLPDDVTAIHLGTLGLVLEPMAGTLLDLLRREAGRRVVMVDPNVRTGLLPDGEYRSRLELAIRQSTIVKASDGDLAWLLGDVGIETAAEQLLALGPALVVVTLGGRGAFAAHGVHRVTVPAAPVRLVDTIGAGDAFGAALLAWLHENDLLQRDLRLDERQLRSALEYACQAAAITCSRAGADPPWRREIG